jgi:hypothetical protein
MRVRSQHYGKTCVRCGDRVRAGKRFVIDPEDSRRLYHARCWELMNGER